jgi:biopolymer transport protein ExbD
MRFRTRPQPNVLGFQIAPMVDVLLVLLCFFIVTRTYARRENELDVRLPTAQNAQETNPALNQHVLNVKADGAVVWNRKAVSKDELTERLTELASLFPDYAIIVRADRQTPWDYVHAVIDIVQGAGIWNVAFASAKEE